MVNRSALEVVLLFGCSVGCLGVLWCLETDRSLVWLNFGVLPTNRQDYDFYQSLYLLVQFRYFWATFVSD